MCLQFGARPRLCQALWPCHRPFRGRVQSPAVPIQAQDRNEYYRTVHGVSVLIPTFNRGEMLLEALESVLGQSVAPHQVVVIDDGSTDGTAERLTRYGDRVEYIRKDNGGKSSALNLGLTRVTGELVWVFDDDDVALPGSIADRLEVLEGKPDCGLVLARHYWGASSASGAIEAVRNLAGRLWTHPT